MNVTFFHYLEDGMFTFTEMNASFHTKPMFIVLFVLLLFSCYPAHSESTSATSHTSLLTLRALNDSGTSELIREFDRQTLEALPQQKISTKTPWTDGISEFSGPLLRDVLANSTSKGTLLRCTALNDYSIEIPSEDAALFDVILAMNKDGKTMSTREKGPLWIIYPWSANTALWKETYFSRSIWQLREIEIRK
jgi:hypothetical protein